LNIEVIKTRIILEGYRGSITHGTYIPSEDPNSIDDIDTIGIFVAPMKYYCGLGNIRDKAFDTAEIMEGKYDRIYYDVKKFFRLLLQGNPNVVSLLWLNPKHYIKKTEFAEKLLSYRNLFISKQAFYRFAGYARSQMDKMYHNKCDGYMGEKRKKIVAKYGYDIKNASHLIRLLHMCIDFLETGQYVVERPEKDKLIDIKTGKWELHEVKEEAGKLFKLAEDKFKKCTLPEYPNWDVAEKLLMKIICSYNGYPHIVS